MITAEQVAELSRPWIFGALERAADRLEGESEKLLEKGNYAAEIPAGDADSIRSVIAALPAIATQSAELAAIRAECERLRLEAGIQAQEARSHRDTVHECYQAVTGSTGEPGNWHGAKPVRDELSALRTELATLRAANARQAAALWRIAHLEKNGEWDLMFYDAQQIAATASQFESKIDAAEALSQEKGE